MTNRQRVAYEGSAAEKRDWSAEQAVWKCVLDDAAAELHNILSIGVDRSKFVASREYFDLRDRAAHALLESQEEINDDTLRTLLSIEWQTKAIFGTNPPIERMVRDELECRGHFPEFLDLPAWFTDRKPHPGVGAGNS